ncbi:MAG: SLC13 family permease [Limisphaerales bacterium]|jgi:di/tricarboxylate transporter|nr:dATP pyrophosphohydrolase [Pedosphaera sp.]MAN30401.1 dATP pyrophosphohydrolase [Pedosphaera sp.]MEC7904823.1 SLC13 family permease [Verrucomicrobiota bacterium]HBF03202.1 dATP pyrophosphohydrolase [Verrucomicrobiales bacterium]HCQ85404.1 dATP pyrophosphohydrolase [Verrucomicrobiales bacterium]
MSLTAEMLMVFGLMAVVFMTMIVERLRSDVIAGCAMVFLMLGGILSPQELFQVFGNEAVVTVACMFVLSSALERTGVIARMGALIDPYVGRNDLSVSLFLLPLVAVLSAFINNTPVVLVFMPMVMAIAARQNIRPSKLLIPLSFASIFGGCCTLIGTSTNILVSSTAERMGERPFEMFDLTLVGSILAVVGMVYLWTFGRKILPERETLSTILQTTQNRQFFTEAIVVPGSSLIGQRLSDSPIASLPKARIIEVIRGDELIGVALNEIVFEAGDRVRMSTVLSSVMELKDLSGLEIQQQDGLDGLEWVGTQKAALVECVVSPRSSMMGKTIARVDLRRAFGVLVLAVHRHGVNLREKLQSTVLQYGDTLLLEGTETAIKRLRESRDLIVLGEQPHLLPLKHKQWLAGLSIVFMVVASVFTSMPIGALALSAAIFVILSGCLDMDEAYKAIDWRVIFLICGMLGIGLALEKTSGVGWLAENMIALFGYYQCPGFVIISGIILLTSVLTTFLSNNAVAVIMTPIAIEVAQFFEMNPAPFMVAVAMGASACFASPVGYQTNALVYGAGGYVFRDFIRVGLPLNLLIWLTASIAIPSIWGLWGWHLEWETP